MKIVVRTVLSLSLLSLFGCGGGGGSDAPDYSGAWSGGVSLVSNTCPRAIPDEFLYIGTLHNVDQSVSEDSDGNTLIDIVLEDGIDTYVGIGQVDAAGNGNSFSAIGSPHILPGFLSGFECTEIIDFEYDDIIEDDYSLFAQYLTRHSTISCKRGTEVRTCDVTYTGTSSRYK